MRYVLGSPANRPASIAVSMGSRGDCYDNAVAESFFVTQKELIRRRSWPLRRARAARSSTTSRPSTTPSAGTRPRLSLNRAVRASRLALRERDNDHHRAGNKLVKRVRRSGGTPGAGRLAVRRAGDTPARVRRRTARRPSRRSVIYGRSDRAAPPRRACALARPAALRRRRLAYRGRAASEPPYTVTVRRRSSADRRRARCVPRVSVVPDVDAAAS